ncbi:MULTISPECIES: hypothetical protein [Pseudomonas]|uniref:Uncharacterized protein n=1 Tax=Pseudomonas izuensis TaxID=2684212 RepID=A0ABM7RX63_9PSED|nr:MULTISPECIES: hypothetical protein [Pseudomonas]RKS24813.1 hypothetical protein BJ917_2294 [Pseudomonas sp. WPR_5_2]BCX69107.1 hypothetical protein LAB08_R37490 [Pseudomonas izuensis]
MRDDFTNNQVVRLACVYLTKTEHYQLDSFIGQYIKTRNLQTIPHINDILSSTLEDYPGKPPVMVNELNAWIDKTLGYRAAHPDFLSLE